MIKTMKKALQYFKDNHESINTIIAALALLAVIQSNPIVYW